MWNYFTAFTGQCTDLRAHVFFALLHFYLIFLRTLTYASARVHKRFRLTGGVRHACAAAHSVPPWDVSGLSDVRLICNSSPFLPRQTSGCVELSGRWMGQGRGGKTWEWHNTDCLCDTLAWFYSAAGNPPMCDGWHVWKVNRHVLLWVMCKTRGWSGFSASLSRFSSLTLCPPLPGAQTLPSPVYRVSITCPSASRMRHVWGLKIKDEADGCKEREGWGSGGTAGRGWEGGHEGERREDWPAEVMANKSISAALMSEYCLAGRVSGMKGKKPHQWEIMDTTHKDLKIGCRHTSWRYVCQVFSVSTRARNTTKSQNRANEAASEE